MSWATQPTFPPNTIPVWPSETSAEGLVDYLTGKPLSQRMQTVDVLVYGATFPGIFAAIKAAVLGRNVILVTPRNDLGGMPASGLQYTDAWGTIKNRASLPTATLVNELYSRLATIYSKNQQTFYQANSYSSESKSTLLAINAMLVQYGVGCITSNILQSITMAGTRITSAVFDKIGKVNARVFVDGTYTSDLYAMTGGDYIIGSEARALYGETTQKAGFQITGPQYTNPIDPYITPGVSASGLIKWVYPDALLTDGDAVPNKVQHAGARLSVTNATFASGQKIAFPAPANYVASDYEFHRRDALANKQSATLFSQFVNLQGGSIINSTTSTAKQDMNTGNGGLISIDYPNVAENAEYVMPGTTWARRMQIETNILQYALGYIYFLQTDSSIPAAVKTNLGTYGLNTDDFQATGYLPPFMYIREGLRAVGTTPITANDINNFNSSADYIGFAYYTFDSHSRGNYVQPSGGDHVIQEGLTPAALPSVATMARVPMRLVWPKVAQVTNVLLTWGMNSSRSAYCSLRVEPFMGVVGEGVGAMAHLACTKNINVQSIAFSDLRPLQNLYGFDTPGALCITTDGTTRTNGTVAQSGWSTATGNIYGTTNYLFVTTPTGAETITFTPTIAFSSRWRVQVKYADDSSIATRGSISWVTTASGVAQTAVVLNESVTATTSGDWQDIGTFTMIQGDTIVGTSVASANQANAIAVRLIPA